MQTGRGPNFWEIDFDRVLGGQPMARLLGCRLRCAVAAVGAGGPAVAAADFRFTHDDAQRRWWGAKEHLPCPRYFVPLERRYAGTAAERSARGRVPPTCDKKKRVVGRCARGC